MYKELEQEVLDERIENINQDPLKNATKPQVVPQQYNTHTNVQSKQLAEVLLISCPLSFCRIGFSRRVLFHREKLDRS